VKTTVAKDPGADRAWFIVDASDKVLGRMSTTIANVLRGKNKPSFTPHVDTGDFVVVINAEKVRLTGNKEDQKKYQRYTGYRGGLREVTASDMRTKHPDRLVKFAVTGMLPKNKLNRKIVTRLKVYAGSEHPHEAQNPQELKLT
jgi:large subunit ribosomal protein L13